MTTKFECFTAASMREVRFCRHYNIALSEWYDTQAMLMESITSFVKRHKTASLDIVSLSWDKIWLSAMKANTSFDETNSESEEALHSPRRDFSNDELKVGLFQHGERSAETYQMERWPQHAYIDHTNIPPLMAPRFWCIDLSLVHYLSKL